ncbi:unnamed protein product, partial [Prunus brigantina]
WLPIVIFVVPQWRMQLILYGIAQWQRLLIFILGLQTIYTTLQIWLMEWSGQPCLLSLAGFFGNGGTKIFLIRGLKGEDGRIAAGGVLRDSSGQWMRGFAVNLGVGQVLEAELWGIYLGLKLAWDIGCSAVVFESDSATAVHLLNKNVEDLHHLATMLWGCKDYINKNWVCSIHHVYRECNMVGDKLAELGSCLELGLSTFQDPPDSIRSFLSEDLL